jgi:hypothetical protein
MAEVPANPSVGHAIFRAFGLTISSDLHFPELLPGTGRADVSVRYGDVPVVPSESNPQGIWFHALPGEFALHIEGVGRFLVRNADEIVVDRHPDATDDEIRLFVLGSCFGALLHQRGYLVLHGSTVQVGKTCVAFLGRSGVGKSTLAAELGRRGYPCLGDDVCAVSIGEDGVPYAVPAYPQAKLHVDALHRMGLDEAHFRRVRPSLEKRAVPIQGNFDRTRVPVTRVYVLSPGWLKLDPIIQSITGSARFRVLRDYTYRVEFLHGLDLSRQHFHLAAQLAACLPVKRIVRRTDTGVVEELADAVEQDFGAAHSSALNALSSSAIAETA